VLKVLAELQPTRSATLKLYGLSKVNYVARGHTRELRVLARWPLDMVTHSSTVADILIAHVLDEISDESRIPAAFP